MSLILLPMAVADNESNMEGRTVSILLWWGRGTGRWHQIHQTGDTLWFERPTDRLQIKYGRKKQHVMKEQVLHPRQSLMPLAEYVPNGIDVACPPNARSDDEPGGVCRRSSLRQCWSSPRKVCTSKGRPPQNKTKTLNRMPPGEAKIEIEVD